MLDLFAVDPTPAQLERLRKVPVTDLACSSLLVYAALQHPGYKLAPHNTALARALMKVERGAISRLMVFMPPRHGKTMLASEFFPAWYLGRNPQRQVIAATYSFDRATDVGRKVRNQVVDPLFREIFPSAVASSDSKGANKMSLLAGGNYFSVGIGGATTGRGADLFLIDDPIKGREDADSQTAQRKLRDWYRSVAYTRLMPGKSAIVLIMTRWHFYDLAGWLLDEQAHENWHVLSLPAICDTADDPLDRQYGEALWPDAYPVSVLKKIKTSVGTREWNALYQQKPIADEGGMVNLDWFKRYGGKQWRAFRLALKAGADPGTICRSKAPYKKFGFKQIVISWDTAFKTEQLNDPSAATVWGITKDNQYFLLHVINRKFEFPDLVKRVVRAWEDNCRIYRLDGHRVITLIEDKASGQSLIQQLKRDTRMPVVAIRPEGNKVLRLSETTAVMESGRVHLPEKAPWLVDYETQMIQFPFGKHDDMVDSTSQFLRWATRPRFVRGLNERYWK